MEQRRKRAVFLALLAVFIVIISHVHQKSVHTTDPKNASFTIEGKPITLANGHFEQATAPESSSKFTVDYFGNEAKGDFNNDGKEDTAFLVTANSGGSGTFFYLATTLGGEAFLIGDRIAPQTTEWRNGEIIVNYATRKENEPMTAQPSVGVSRYFEIENNNLTEIKKENPGQPSGEIRGKVSLSPTCPVERNPPEQNCAPKAFITDVFALKAANREVVAQTHTSSTGEYILQLPAGDYVIHASTTNIFPRCMDRNVSVQSTGAVIVNIACDSGIR